MARVTSDRALFGTKDGRVVEAGDPDAQVQLASRAGKELSARLTEVWPIEQFMKDNPLGGKTKAQHRPAADKMRRADADK